MGKDFVNLYSNCTVTNLIDGYISRHRHFNPDRFKPSGLTCFCGVQGSGKTLSAVLYVKKLMDMYPKSLCVTNIALNSEFFDSERVIPYFGVEQMRNINNGEYGVIFLLDEIQIEFNSLESKYMGINVFELVCQQRKQRKHIVGTTQVFARLAKPFREQFKYCVLCSNFFGSLFIQKVYSAENVASEDDVTVQLTPKATKFYFAHPRDFDLYDTYQVISRIQKDGVVK